jgi:uncharacterized protein GlcG (DUF336 family)
MTAQTAAPFVTRADISAATAQRLVAEVHAECERRGIRLAAAVVDAGGNLVAAARMDDAQLGALSLATDKAFTAVSFGFPTSAWVSSSAPGGSDWGLGSTLGGRAVVFTGGIPVLHHGRMIGGLGVSGAASTTDEACAIAAATVCGVEVSA